jgi:hypothetical protein
MLGTRVSVKRCRAKPAGDPLDRDLQLSNHEHVLNFKRTYQKQSELSC